MGIDQGIGAAVCEGLHKGIGDADRQIKIRHLGWRLLSAVKSRMSGWSIRRMPIFAPRLVPPCLMTSVERLKRRMKEMGPDATPLDDATRSL